MASTFQYLFYCIAYRYSFFQCHEFILFLHIPNVRLTVLRSLLHLMFPTRLSSKQPLCLHFLRRLRALPLTRSLLTLTLTRACGSTRTATTAGRCSWTTSCRTVDSARSPARAQAPTRPQRSLQSARAALPAHSHDAVGERPLGGAVRVPRGDRHAADALQQSTRRTGRRDVQLWPPTHAALSGREHDPRHQFAVVRVEHCGVGRSERRVGDRDSHCSHGRTRVALEARALRRGRAPQVLRHSRLPAPARARRRRRALRLVRGGRSRRGARTRSRSCRRTRRSRRTCARIARAAECRRRSRSW